MSGSTRRSRMSAPTTAINAECRLFSGSMGCCRRGATKFDPSRRSLCVAPGGAPDRPRRVEPFDAGLVARQFREIVALQCKSRVHGLHSRSSGRRAPNMLGLAEHAGLDPIDDLDPTHRSHDVALLRSHGWHIDFEVRIGRSARLFCAIVPVCAQIGPLAANGNICRAAMFSRYRGGTAN
jgi:hypothetical protein